MFKIEQVFFKNFKGSQGGTRYSIGDQGLTLISGKTGAGKSTIADAIIWALYGQTMEGSKMDEVVNDTVNKNCVVEVIGTIDNVPLQVVRYRKHTTNGNDLEVRYGDNLLQGRIPDIQKDLESILNMDFDKFLLLTLFTTRRIRHFADATPKQRIDIFADLLSELQIFEKAYSLTHEYLKESAQKKIELENDISKNIALIGYCKDSIKECEEGTESWEALKVKKLTQLEKELKSEKQEMKNLGAKPQPPKDLTNRIEDQIDSVQKDVVKIQVEISSEERKLGDMIDLSNLEGSPCPTCTRTVTKNLVDKVRKSEEERAKEIRQSVKKLIPQKRELEIELEELKSKRNNLKKEEKNQYEKYTNWESKYQMLKFSIHNIEGQIEGLKEEKNPYIGQLEKAKTSLAVEEKKLKKFNKELEEENNYHKLLSATKTLYSKDGVGYFYIRDCLHLLETETRQALNKISNGRMDVRITLNEDDEINLSVTIGNKIRSYDGQASNGERHAVDCALIFGFNRMAVKKSIAEVNAMFLDEILDNSLDDEGEENLFGVLNLLAEHIESVFVISHRAEFKALFNKVWEIE